MCQRCFKLKRIERLLVVIQPARKHLNSQSNAIAVCAPIALAQHKFRLRKRCINALAVDALLHVLRAALFDTCLKLRRYTLMSTFKLKHNNRLCTLIYQHCAHVVTKICLKHIAFKRRIVGCTQAFDNNACCKHLFVRNGRIDNIAYLHHCVVRRSFHGKLHGLWAVRTLQAQLIGRAHGRRCVTKMLVDNLQHIIQAEVAIQNGIAVCKLVVAFVRVDKLLIRKVWNFAHITSRHVPVAGVAKQRFHCFVVQHRFGARKRPAHFV